MLLGEEGRPLGAKLVDFGFAHVNGSSIHTPPGTALGTVAYMAPEQVLGDRIDGRCDIYGLGMLAYRMLAGAPPFEGEGLDLMARQLTVPLPPLPSGAGPLSAELVRVIARATRKSPEHRYPTARMLREDLQRVAGITEGPLQAETLPDGEDRFSPGPGLPRQAARFLYGRLGLTAPAWGD
jgi:serine/threonine-protein kinase